MNVSYQWLREIAPGLEGDAVEVADRLAALGAPADAVTAVGAALGDVVVGRVLEVAKHPNADRLTLCRVDAGGEAPVNVVCGAPNVQAGAFYPFIPVGGVLPGGVKIRKAKIRGEVSAGMLCSARELELGHDHMGILRLGDAHEPGAPFVDAAGLDDTRLELDITADRPDLLCHMGVARALEGVTGVRIPPIPGTDVATSTDPAMASAGAQAEAAGARIEIEDTEACMRFLGTVIEGVRVGPSPEWLEMRLRAVGLRPINNVVDVTNFVNHELGRPMHAYDLDRVRGRRIGVRWGAAGEKVVTLDGEERKLSEGMLVIADAEGPIGLAGVMGGLDSEVSDATTTVFLELAHFDPKSVRATRRAAGLTTDASFRFERGVDPDAAEPALRRALAMIVELTGGQVVGDIGDAHPAPSVAHEVTLRTDRVRHLLGVPLTTERVRELLAPIGLEVVDADADATTYRVPGHRLTDLTREVDLIEEVARHAGYDSFPEERLPIRPSAVPDAPLSVLEGRLRERWVGRGFLEARTAAFAPEEEGDVALLNPLSSEESRLRRSLVPGLIRRLRFNQARGARDVRLFEIGTGFAAALSEDDMPRETTRLAAAFTGARRAPHWESPVPEWDVWDARGLLEDMADALELSASVVGWSAAAPRTDIGASLGGTGLDAPSALRLIDAEGAIVGVAGPVAAAVADAPPWSAPWWALEVLLPSDPDLSDRRRLIPLPAQPAVERDLALATPIEMPAAEVDRGIRAAASELLVGLTLFDVYVGPGVDAGRRSLAFRLRFQAPDRTLTDSEVDAEVARVLDRLAEELDVRQRS
ncbi:MAG: phenylalanine--tRNA ligase subunit beta [Gemmatimonadota bacterium]